jgi:hypothetical protein
MTFNSSPSIASVDTSPLFLAYLKDIPEPLTRAMYEAVKSGYAEATLIVAEMHVDFEFEPNVIGQIRHALINRNFRRLIEEAGFDVKVHPTQPKGYFYVLVEIDCWTFTVGKVDHGGRFPETEYRRMMRTHGSLFPETGLVPEGTLNCELIHGPQDDDRGTLGSAEMCLVGNDGTLLTFDFLEYARSVARLPVLSLPDKKAKKPEAVVVVRRPSDTEREEEQGT